MAKQTIMLYKYEGLEAKESIVQAVDKKDFYLLPDKTNIKKTDIHTLIKSKDEILVMYTEMPMRREALRIISLYINSRCAEIQQKLEKLKNTALECTNRYLDYKEKTYVLTETGEVLDADDPDIRIHGESKEMVSYDTIIGVRHMHVDVKILKRSPSKEFLSMWYQENKMNF